MNTEIVCSLITTGGLALSGLLSWFISRSTANKEIEKMEHSWAHEVVISSDEEFSEMASAVGVFAASHHSKDHHKAIAAVGVIRAKESGRLAESLDKLHSILLNGPYYREDIDRALSQVIDEKRKAKSDAYGADRQQPAK